ncbi:neutral/alkaline non-lysosomal ceramidase N-terminal domain-containing protein [Lutimonas saemankumensis]|uniref:neutral/alkaline non-lysosomal ceramidase N-terminal domain-containing protein n=1 Tax=Lutimonas saemankumensis TaxID=483016 RepID=UPI001CD2127A|nr:neutral/alkaline non-lysosomal ceramidase N-terminal domain-containing protein [Lutimonas saemankumensis]MCA0932384.1 neutral/alkaline non-lysosomal ceramidase N-terminal domain-containing protein [Lutimonas saemankumensis]
MIRYLGIKIFGAAVIIFLGLLLGCDAKVKDTDTAKSEFWAGASSESINPDVGMFIAGDKPNRRFTGIHDSLYAKAVVVRKDNEILALVTLDCIGLLYPDTQRIRKKTLEIINDTLIKPERIIVTSNHVHSGPDVVGIWGPNQLESGVDSVYMNRMIEATAMQVKKAFESMKPANIFSASGEFGEEWVSNICEPEEIDRALEVIQFSDISGRSIATLTNFACHPTFYDAVQNEVSADYVGAYYEDLSKSMEGEHMFFQGAIGGWVQPLKEDQSFEVGQKRGEELSKEVQRLLKEKQELVHNDIDFRNEVFELPVSNPGWAQLSAAGVIKRDISSTTKTEMAWFKIGEAQFITHPGETPPAFSFASKNFMDKGPKFVIGLGLDAMGYILKPEYFDPESSLPHAEYLTRMSPGREAGPLILEKIEKLIAQPE